MKQITIVTKSTNSASIYVKDAYESYEADGFLIIEGINGDVLKVNAEDNNIDMMEIAPIE